MLHMLLLDLAEKRWCDLTVKEYVAIERSMVWASGILQALTVGFAGWLFMRWRAKRQAKILADIGEPPPPPPIA